MFFLLEKHENLLRGVEKANPRGMSQSYRQPKTIELPPFRGEKLPSQPQKSGRYVPVAFQPLKTPSLPFVVWQKLNGHWADHDYGIFPSFLDFGTAYFSMPKGMFLTISNRSKFAKCPFHLQEALSWFPQKCVPGSHFKERHIFIYI